MTEAGPTEPLHAAMVDDDFYVRETFKDYMQGRFDSLEIFAEPRAVIDRFEEANPPNVLLTDGEMPGMTGLQLARHIRDNFPGTTIALISGGVRDFDPFDSAQLEAHGIDLYIPKSKIADQLDSLVNNIREFRQQHPSSQNPT